MNHSHVIDGTPLSLGQLRSVLAPGCSLSLSENVRSQVTQCRNYLDEKIADSNGLYYGINTGFGSLCNIRISPHQIEELQHNLVLSHATGTGDEVPADIVRLIIFLKIQSLSQGYSGVQVETVERLIHLYNHNITPVLFELGSLGASGDLAPLAHLSLALIGKGKVRYQGKVWSTDELPADVRWEPLILQSKEGLALLNGTQFSAAYAIYAQLAADRIVQLADMIAALSIDVFLCKRSPFDARLQRIRKHNGQVKSAEAIRYWRENSELSVDNKLSVQDPYAFRCVPQVHGASRAAFDHCRQIFEAEMNAVTDNPNIFRKEDAILSGGNFHAQVLALPLDYMAIALSELASISERRTYQLISGKRDLPTFLTDKSGLHSGYMIAQYTAASIVSQNKQLCTPASVDSIISSNGQEDHVSMSANAGTKLYRVVKNVERVLAIEFMVAAQGLEFRRPKLVSSRLEAIVGEFRKVVPKLEEDRVISTDLDKTISFLKQLPLSDEG